MTAKSSLAQRGEIVRREVMGDAHVDRTAADPDPFMRMFHEATEEICWGAVWARPGLDRKMRSILSLAMTAAQGQAPAVKAHAKTSLAAGWTKEEIGEVLIHAYCYAGVYKSLSSFQAAKEAFDELEREQAP